MDTHERCSGSLIRRARRGEGGIVLEEEEKDAGVEKFHTLE